MPFERMQNLSRHMATSFAVASGVWLVVAATLIGTEWFAEKFDMPWPMTVYLWITVLVSPVCFVMYGLDKRRARKEQPRIAERWLHLAALLGGWPGAAIGGQLFRHKTQKLSFRLVFWLIVVLHLALIGYGIYRLVNQAD
jgi:uncharacterized membrane protein YsdA (DUF1294 family)